MAQPKKLSNVSLTVLVALAATFAGLFLGGDTVHAEGLTATGAQFFHQDIAGLDDSAETLDRFGSALASGDFNGDGYDDLAIGVPYEDVFQSSTSTTIIDAGSVTVLYGDGSGLYDAGGDFWSVDTLSPGLAETNGHFGVALAAGDYDGDTYDDLVVAEDQALNGCACRTSGIWVIPGSAAGLTTTGAGEPFAFTTTFGGGSAHRALAMADFDGDGDDDIVYSGATYSENIVLLRGWAYVRAGELPVFIDVGEEPTVLAAGQFDGDAGFELAAGFPTDTDHNGGQVKLCLSMCGTNEVWSQDSSGIVGASEAGDAFGAALAPGDFDGDGCEDLAVGVPGEDAAANNQGAFQIIYGDCSGLTSSGNNLIGAIQVQESALYASTLAAGDFDTADTADELASDAPWQNVSFSHDGLFDVRYSSATTTVWHQDVTGVPDTNEAGDEFGRALATGDFNGDGADDLAIGVPRESINGQSFAGAVTILYGTSAAGLDTDGDGCPDVNEQQTAPGSETSGGLRDYTDPDDYYDVLGPGGSLTHDGVIDLANDILGVIQHYAPTGLAPYNVHFDRGPSGGPNPWNMTAPDGVIDLPNDVLGVILQFNHNCV